MTSDFLVIGGGVIGLSIARELKRRCPDATVTLIEKEEGCGRHASGRNSGVLHAGFYYSPDSLKARFTRDGNKRLRDYCEARRLSIRPCGKLVVARDERDQPAMDRLLRRARKNGVELHELTAAEAKRIEPRVKTHGRALYSPTTTTVDPGQVVDAMKQDALLEGVRLLCGVRYLGRGSQGLHTTAGTFEVGYVVNAAGLYADHIAKDFGCSERYRILPFKGLYLYSDEPVGALKTNVYPVPDPRYPFLGVHFTIMVNGHVKIGPTAVPALWREQYGGRAGFRLSEVFEILVRTFGLTMLSGSGYIRLGLEELAKCSRARMVALASTLVEGIRLETYRRWGLPGIRAQLVDLTTKQLVMDFVVETGDRSFHVLNAVSPGFTCALPFADYVCDRIETSLN